jgi:hypothetical protein
VYPSVSKVQPIIDRPCSCSWTRSSDSPMDGVRFETGPHFKRVRPETRQLTRASAFLLSHSHLRVSFPTDCAVLFEAANPAAASDPGSQQAMFHLIFRQLASRCHLCFVELAATAEWLVDRGVVPPCRHDLLDLLLPAATERVRHNTRYSPLFLPAGPNPVSLNPWFLCLSWRRRAPAQSPAARFPARRPSVHLSRARAVSPFGV